MTELKENDVVQYHGTYYQVVHSEKYQRPNLMILPQTDLIKLIKEGQI